MHRLIGTPRTPWRAALLLLLLAISPLTPLSRAVADSPPGHQHSGHAATPRLTHVQQAAHHRAAGHAATARVASRPAVTHAALVPTLSDRMRPWVMRSPYTLPIPPVLSRAAFLYDVTDREILYAQNADLRLPMASTTKIMTALLALKYGHLDDWVTASHAAATIGESTMYLQEGEVLRLRDLLYGLLLPSGNDAAIAIAEHVGGSVPAFVAMMNREAAALGMTNTHFATPHGLDAPGHFTSARDLARLAVATMQYPLFRQIVSTRYYTIPATSHNVAHNLVNINQPLWWYPGTIGVKPGTTDAARRCAVEWVAHKQRTLLLVQLGGDNLVTDVRDLLDWGFGNFSRWYSPLLVPEVHAPEYFGWDGPRYWVPVPATEGRFYVRSGHTVRPPLLAPYLAHGGVVRFGAPTSEEFLRDGVWQQRFAGAWLFFNPRTGKIAAHEQQVL